jgi:hypothetical protein
VYLLSSEVTAFIHPKVVLPASPHSTPPSSANLSTLQAEYIYDLFVSESADKCINLEACVRKDIKNLYDNANDLPLQVSLFKQAEEAIFTLMEKDLFPRFLKSEGYASFVQTVKTAKQGNASGDEFGDFTDAGGEATGEDKQEGEGSDDEFGDFADAEGSTTALSLAETKGGLLKVPRGEGRAPVSFFAFSPSPPSTLANFPIFPQSAGCFFFFSVLLNCLASLHYPVLSTSRPPLHIPLPPLRVSHCFQPAVSFMPV